MLFSKRKNDDLVLILDVQSGLARSALVLYREGQIPKILFVHSTLIPHKSSTDSRHVINSTVKATANSIGEALKYLSRQKHNRAAKSDTKKDASDIIPYRVSEVHYVLSSPWIMSEAKRIEISFDTNKMVKEDMIRKMVSEDREKLAEEARAKGKIIPVEEKIFDVKLNGYSVTNWQNREARSLSVSFVTSISGTKMVGRFKDLCSHVVFGHKVFFHSSLLLQHIALNEVNPRRETYVIIHIHGEVTDIVEVDKHACIYFATFPIGTETMLRMFAKETKTDLQVAASMLNIRNSHLSLQTSEKNTESMNKINEYWFKKFENSMKAGPLSMEGGMSLVVSSKERLNSIVGLLREKYPKVSVEMLDGDDLSTFVSYDIAAERHVMISLYAESLGKLRRK